jgi:hypothetical protein
MFRLRILFLLTSFILCTSNAFSATSIIDSYNSLDESKKLIFDTIREEFKSDHYEFLGEKSSLKTLLFALGVPDNPNLDKSHEESNGHEHGEDEHLNVSMVEATKEDAKLDHNPVVEIGPFKLTYKKLYVVELSDKNITFQVFTDADGVPGRESGVPDSKLIERIASRLKGTIQGNAITLP